jgi:hypothetical protein
MKNFRVVYNSINRMNIVEGFHVLCHISMFSSKSKLWSHDRHHEKQSFVCFGQCTT